jgi:hypothetical protein
MSFFRSRRPPAAAFGSNAMRCYPKSGGTSRRRHVLERKTKTQIVPCTWAILASIQITLPQSACVAALACSDAVTAPRPPRVDATRHPPETGRVAPRDRGVWRAPQGNHGSHSPKQQLAAISARLTLPPSQTWASPPDTAPKSAIEARIAAAMEQFLERHEYGEIEWTDVSPQGVYEMAFLDD